MIAKFTGTSLKQQEHELIWPHTPQIKIGNFRDIQIDGARKICLTIALTWNWINISNPYNEFIKMYSRTTGVFFYLFIFWCEQRFDYNFSLYARFEDFRIVTF